MDKELKSSYERQTKRLIVIMVVLGIGSSYLLATDEGGFPFTTAEVLLGVGMGALYLFLAYYEDRLAKYVPQNYWPGLFFGVEILLVFGIGWFVGPGVLLLSLPLVGMAVEKLSRRQRWLVYAGILAALVLPIGLLYSSWAVALINLVADSAAIAFVVLFTQMRMSERDARREAESLNRELKQANRQIAAFAAQELTLAWQIQKSLMPENLPDIPNWDISVSLVPARETSGDFYDVIPLPNGSYGILIADVTDKGLGAALFMALSRTILRTYALRHLDNPARVIMESNARVLLDAKSSMYVTTFYGILEPKQGLLTYCNAGHDPPILLRSNPEHDPGLLKCTGVPIGVFEETEWEQKSLQLDQENALVMYSDGFTDAENSAGEHYGFERLMDVSKSNYGNSAGAMCRSMMETLDEFIQGAPRFDDITLMTMVHQAHRAPSGGRL